MGGYEWEILFDSGRRFRLAACEFEADSVTAWQARHTGRQWRHATRALLEVDQFRARQTLEALRLGIVPVQDVETLTIGLEAERVSLDRALARSMERGGDALAVIGDYGFGKSHFVELAARRALHYHSIAYGYEYPPPPERYERVVQTAPGLLSRALNQHQINLREVIRLAVTTGYLLYLHADYAPETLLEELAKGLRV